MTGQVTLTGDTRIAGGNAPTFNLNYPTRTVLTITPGNILSGKVTGPFNFDFGAAASINTDATLTNAGNDWTGNTQIIGRGGGNARVRLGGSEVIPDGLGKGNLLFNANGPAVLDMMGFSETVNGVSDAPSTNANNAFIENNSWGVTVDTSAGPNAARLRFHADNFYADARQLRSERPALAGSFATTEAATSIFPERLPPICSSYPTRTGTAMP